MSATTISHTSACASAALQRCMPIAQPSRFRIPRKSVWCFRPRLAQNSVTGFGSGTWEDGKPNPNDSHHPCLTWLPTSPACFSAPCWRQSPAQTPENCRPKSRQGCPKTVKRSGDSVSSPRRITSDTSSMPFSAAQTRRVHPQCQASMQPSPPSPTLNMRRASPGNEIGEIFLYPPRSSPP